jgi:DNA-binding response OmpR family regulator
MMDCKVLYNKTKTLSVLLVEDFEPLRREMMEVLEDLFNAVVVASNGEEALALYRTAFSQNPQAIDLVITDIQMPKMNGVVLTKNIRVLNPQQEIIVLSAHTDSQYLLELLNIGVSRFLTKPIQHDEFFEILYEQCKKIYELKQSVTDVTLVEIGENYTWNTLTHELRHNNLSIELTKYELLLLRFFLKYPERIVNNQHIIDYFESYKVELNQKNIRNLIFKLRQKIPKECIQSVYGLGYKFVL